MTNSKKRAKTTKGEIIHKLETANIANGCIIRTDGMRIIATRIIPIDIDLLSQKDQIRLSNKLRGNLNGIAYRWEILKIDRRVSLEGLISNLEKDAPYKTSAHKQACYILTSQAKSIVASGMYKEPRFYALISGTRQDQIEANMSDLRRRLDECDIDTLDVMDDELMHLVNMALNPAESTYSNAHTFNITGQIPALVWENNDEQSATAY